MKTHSKMAMLTVVLCAGSLIAQPAPTQQTPERYGRVQMTIVTDPRTVSIPAEEEQAKASVFRNDIMEVAGQEAFGQYNPAWITETKLLDRPKDIDGMQITRAELTVRLDEQSKPAARAFVEAYVRRLQDALTSQHEKQMRVYADRQTEYARQVRATELRLQELMQEQKALPSGTLDTESLKRRMQEQDNKLAENAAEQAALKTRIEGLSAYINSVQSQPAPVNSDASSRQLREQISRWETRLQQEQAAEEDKQQHNFDAPILTSWIADAKLLLAYRKSQLEDQAAAEVRGLEQERRETTMQLEELAAREQALASTEVGSPAQSARYDVLQVQIQAARETLHDALREAEKFNAQMALIQKPVVTYDVILFSDTPPAAG